MNDISFSFTPRSLPKGFPDSIKISGFVFGVQLGFTLNKLEGLAKNLSLVSPILIQDNASASIVSRESSNLVTIFLHLFYLYDRYLLDFTIVL